MFDPELETGFEGPELEVEALCFVELTFGNDVGVVVELADVFELALLEESVVVVVVELSFFANCSASIKALTFWKSSESCSVKGCQQPFKPYHW